jgi:hypothetical protein
MQYAMQYPNIPEIFPEKVKVLNLFQIKVLLNNEWKLMELNPQYGTRVYLHGGPSYLANHYTFVENKFFEV